MGGRGDRRAVLWVLFKREEGGQKIVKKLFRSVEERVRILFRLVTERQEEFLMERLGWRGYRKFVHDARSPVANRPVELLGGGWQFICLLGGLMREEAKAKSRSMRWSTIILTTWPQIQVSRISAVPIDWSWRFQREFRFEETTLWRDFFLEIRESVRSIQKNNSYDLQFCFVAFQQMSRFVILIWKHPPFFTFSEGVSLFLSRPLLFLFLLFYFLFLLVNWSSPIQE
jgi:hypothetical protein